jgi:cation diffusion facilitator family transporter
MDSHARRATILGIAANAFLFIIKAFAGLSSGSLAIISDAVNSFSDTVYSIAIFVAVKVSSRKADASHPFGHHRAEPVAGLLIAILAGILGFEIIKMGLLGLFGSAEPIFNLFGAAVLMVSMATKAGMWFYFKKISSQINSPAIYASAIDSRNDILISFTALLGFSGAVIGIAHLDCYAGILIGLFIIRSGYKIGIENIDYLMGKSPDGSFIESVRKKAGSVTGVTGVHDIRAHYVGNYIHVQIHIEVDKRMDMQKAHDIGKKVEELVEKMPAVDNAFIHLYPR